MKRTLSMILSATLAVLLTSTAALAGGESCDGKKQVNKIKN